MEGWNGDRWPSWSGHRRETVSSSRSGTIVSGLSTAYTSSGSSSRSGTIVSRLSTAYASSGSSSRSGTIVSGLSTAYTSSGSRFSTFSMETAMHFGSLGLGIHEEHDGNDIDKCEEAEEEETEDEGIIFFVDVEENDESIKSLVQEFFRACVPVPSANCSIKRGDLSVVERWLKELGVGWVLSLHDDPSAGHAGTWIRALDRITHNLCLMRPLFPDGSVGLPGICEEKKGEPVAEKSVADRYRLVLFVQETMLKMLTFVDVVLAWDPDTMEYSSMNQVMYTKLFDLLLVHDALSEASNKIVTLFDSPTSVEVERIENKMVMLLSAYKSKASEVIRSTMEKIRIISMEDGDDSLSPLDPQGSSDIHKVTWSVMTYFDFLIRKSRLVNQVMQGHVPCTENIQPLDNMIHEMASSLQEKLLNISESFSDQGLKFLFLLNNSNHIQLRLKIYDVGGPALLDVGIQRPLSLLIIDLTNKIEGYIERYLQVSWAPLLSFLCNSTPLYLGKYLSLLHKFESGFQKICTTQMEWKVPDPGLRRKLRQAITDKIIPGYTEYIEAKKSIPPQISPQELEAKLQELFEG